MTICQKLLRTIATVLFIFLILPQAYSQTATVSPYSRYGIGELLFNGYSWQRGIGHLQKGVQQPMHLNYGNPASNASDTITLFELGLHGEFINLENSTSSQTKTNGNISYLSMGFPIKKNSWYLTMGMVPYSAEGYKIQQVKSGSEPGNSTNYFSGDGGYNRYYVGSSFRISKSFSFGLTGSYLYGTTNKSALVQFSDAGYINTRATNSTTMSDIYLESGLMYNKTLKNGRIFTMGLTFNPELSMNAKRNVLWVNFTQRNGGLETSKDTVTFVNNEKGTIRLPMNVGFGFSFMETDKWLIGFDATYHQWEKLQIYGEDQHLNNTMYISTGAQWTPDAKSLKYFDKLTYRIGAFYNSPKLTQLASGLGGVFLIGGLFDAPALEVKSTDINEAGITMGVGLPLRGKPFFSDIDVAVEYSERGTVEQNLVRERYIKIMLGLTIREEWFRKPKYE